MDRLLKALRDRGLFRRNRFSLRLKVRACLLYLAGLSYRDIAYVCRVVGASHVSVWRWVQRLEGVRLDVRPRSRRAVAMDETKLKVMGCQLYVWAAIDVKTRELLAIRASWQRSVLDADLFLRQVLKTCVNKPLILVDRGPWYPQALRDHRLRWRHQTFGLRNPIERWFRTLKARTRRFYNNFQTRRGLFKVELFLRLFTLWYNWLKTHQTLGAPPSLKAQK